MQNLESMGVRTGRDRSSRPILELGGTSNLERVWKPGHLPGQLVKDLKLSSR